MMAVLACDNGLSETARCGNIGRPLTHLLDLGERGLAMEATRTCTHPDGCPRPVWSRGWCNAHYRRWRKTGSPGPAALESRQPSSRECRYVGCVESVGNSGARGWCTKHYRRWQVHGNPGKLGYANSGNGLTGERHPLWTGQDATYSAVHQRLRRARGLASAHQCQRCDRPAAQWAYDHLDPAERVDDKYGPYSPDLRRYFPLCASCHKTLDNAWRRGVVNYGGRS